MTLFCLSHILRGGGAPEDDVLLLFCQSVPDVIEISITGIAGVEFTAVSVGIESRLLHC